jgi:hypothetical protein
MRSGAEAALHPASLLVAGAFFHNAWIGHPNWIYELTHDGFRGVAICRSRSGLAGVAQGKEVPCGMTATEREPCHNRDGGRSTAFG